MSHHDASDRNPSLDGDRTDETEMPLGTETMYDATASTNEERTLGDRTPDGDRTFDTTGTTGGDAGTSLENEEHGTEALGAGAGALGGAAIGMAVGGPPGAVVGGAIGAVGGAIAGESTEGDDQAGAGAGGLAGGLAGAAVGGAVAGPPGAVVGGAVGAAGGAGAGDQAEEETEETGSTEPAGEERR